MRRLIVVSLFGCFVSFSANAQPVLTPRSSAVTAELTIPDKVVLPGVPFDMWLAIRNPSDSEVGVGLCADMLVSRDGGAPFVINPHDAGNNYPTLLSDGETRAAMDYVVLPPLGSRVLTVPILDELEGPVYFADERLAVPGSYRISLRLDYCWGLMVPQDSLLPSEFRGVVTTKDVEVERRVVSAADTAVWQQMVRVTGGHWKSVNWQQNKGGQIVLNGVLTSHKDSNYYPYALLASSFGAVDSRAFERFSDALRRFPDSPVAELLQWRLRLIAGSSRKTASEIRELDLKMLRIKRPTTHIIAFGRLDVENICPPDSECGRGRQD